MNDGREIVVKMHCINSNNDEMMKKAQHMMSEALFMVLIETTRCESDFR